MSTWYEKALTAEQIREIETTWLTQCGDHDYGVMGYGCNCPPSDPRPVILRLLAEIGRLQEIEARMKDLET